MLDRRRAHRQRADERPVVRHDDKERRNSGKRIEIHRQHLRPAVMVVAKRDRSQRHQFIGLVGAGELLRLVVLRREAPNSRVINAHHDMTRRPVARIPAPSAHELRGTGQELSVIGVITALGDVEAPGR